MEATFIAAMEVTVYINNITQPISFIEQKQTDKINK